MKSSEEDQGYSVVLTFRVIDGWGEMGGRVGLSGGGRLSYFTSFVLVS